MSRFNNAFNQFEPYGFAYLAADETARAKFPKHIDLLDALEKDPDSGSAEDRRALFTAFAQALDPSGPPPHTSPWKYLGWIVTRYKTDKHNDKPILAEDFDKIYQQLDYLRRYQGSAELDKDITKQTSFADLANRVQPLIDKQTAKSLARQAADDGVTILSQHENGAQLLICHTPAAAKLYGLGTKWCISMQTTNKYFNNYNEHTPITMLLGPITADAQGEKTQEKWALVFRNWWDAADRAHTALPNHIQKILDAMLTGNKNHADFIVQWQQEVIERQANKITDWSNRDDVLAAVMKDGNALQNATDKLQADRAIVLAAVTENGLALKYAAELLRADRDIVLAAVTECGWALKYAAEKFRSDRAIALAAVRQNGTVVEITAKALRADPDIAAAAVKQNSTALRYVAKELQENRKFILKAVENNCLVLEYVAEKFKKDQKIVLAAITQDGLILQYAVAELQADPGFILKAVKKSGRALKYAAEELKADRKTVLAAVTQNGEALEHAAKKLRADPVIVRAAIAQNGVVLKYAAEELKADPEIILAAVTQNGMALHLAAKELRADRKIACAAVTQNGWALESVAKELKADRAFLEEIAPIIIKQNNIHTLLILDSLYSELPEKDEKTSIRIQRRVAGNMINPEKKCKYADDARPDIFITTLWGNPDLVAPIPAFGAMNNRLYAKLQKPQCYC